MRRAKSVDDYIANASDWQEQLVRLREILCSTTLTEELKWGAPCYTWKGKNVVGIGAFKSYFGLWFHQGALLTDDRNVLVNAQEGKTRALRQWRMTSSSEIKPQTIRRYVKEAIGHVDAGREIKTRRKQAVEVPEELTRAMRKHKGATAAFRALTPGRQREYSEYVASAKRLVTRQNRINRILPMIAAGKGLNDRYRP